MRSMTPIAGCVVLASVNHRLPSDPTAIPIGFAPAFSPAVNSVIDPVAGSIAPIADVVPESVNHTFPSGPEMSENGIPPGMGNFVIAPAVVIRPIAPLRSVYQRLPSMPS
jgi:hypothetical protein